MLRDPDRYFAQARERAERDLRTPRSPIHGSNSETNLSSRAPSGDCPSADVPTFQRWGLGTHQQARALHEVTLNHFRRVLGDNHPYTLKSADNLAADLRALGCNEQARQLEAWVRTHR
ncbi:MAG: tetratricopeptide repeat protein [Pseudonocardiaceae bacterium]